MVDLLDVVSVDSVAALKAVIVTAISDGTIYKTTGYYVSGDGGHGSYVYDSGSDAIDDGGSVIKPASNPTNGRWLLLADGINIRQFGAQCKELQEGDTYLSTLSAANNSVRINTAINYCSENSLALLVPAGHYVGTSLSFPDSQGFVLYGEGCSIYGQLEESVPGSVLEMNNSDDALVSFNASSGSSLNRLSNLQIKDLTLIGNASTAVLNTSGTFQSNFKNLTVVSRNATGSGWLSSSSGQSTFENILVLKSAVDTSTTSCGLDLSSGSSPGSVGCTYSNVLSIGFQIGMKCGGNSVDHMSHNTFFNCVSYYCNYGLILSEYCKGNSFVSCVFIVNYCSLSLQSSSNNVFTSCWFSSPGGSENNYVMHIGLGGSSGSVRSESNTFNQCRVYGNSEDAVPVYWEIDNGSAPYALSCVFIDCEFTVAEPTTPGFVINFSASTYLYNVVGSVIRPKFSSEYFAGLFSNFPENIGYEPLNQVLDKFSKTSTADNTWTTIDRLTLNSGDVVTINAAILGKNTTGLPGDPSVDHAAFVMHGTFFLNQDSEAQEVPDATMIVRQKNEENSDQGARFLVVEDSNEVLIQVRGLPDQTMLWSCKTMTLIL